MPASSSRFDVRSNPTFVCLTDALLLREGDGQLGARYVRGSSRTDRADGGGAPPSAGAPASADTPTTRSVGPCFVEPPSPALPRGLVRAVVLEERARHVVEVRALDAQLREVREQRRRLAERAGARWRSWWCGAVWGVAVGASTAAFVSLASASRGVELATATCVVAGSVTLGLVAARGR